jgi:hypothetical protein
MGFFYARPRTPAWIQTAAKSFDPVSGWDSFREVRDYAPSFSVLTRIANTGSGSFRYSLSKMERMMFNFQETNLTRGICPYKLLLNILPETCVYFLPLNRKSGSHKRPRIHRPPISVQFVCRLLDGGVTVIVVHLRLFLLLFVLELESFSAEVRECNLNVAVIIFANLDGKFCFKNQFCITS